MLSKNQVKFFSTLGVGIILLASFLGYSLFTNKEKTYSVSVNISTFSPKHLWEATVAKTNVQNASAHLKDIFFHVNESGIIKWAAFNFWGINKEGDLLRYQVDVASTGELSFRDPIKLDPNKPVPKTIHPYSFFLSLEKAGFLTKNVKITAFAESLNVIYTENYTDLYALKHGKSLPLTFIHFRGVWFSELTIYPFTLDSVVNPPQYFLWHDVQRAYEVTYANTTLSA